MIKFNPNMVRKLRIIHKLSVQEFAKLVGLTRQYIYDLESGKYSPTTKNIEKIANAFDIPITFFYDDNSSVEPSQNAKNKK